MLEKHCYIVCANKIVATFGRYDEIFKSDAYVLVVKTFEKKTGYPAIHTSIF